MRTLTSLVLAGALLATEASAQSHVLVVTGIAGEPKYSQQFHEWASKLIEGLVTKNGVPAGNVTYLSEKEGQPKSAGRSTRENVEKAFVTLESASKPGDAVMIVLIGHGSVEGGAAPRFNLPGPDLSVKDYERLLGKLPDRKIAFVNTASASGGFVESLSSRGRSIVTATRSGREVNETIFAKFFVEAYAGAGADTDKDNQVSLLEAYTFALKETERWYKEQNRMVTEHAQLDDDGDGKASSGPDGRSGDGLYAKAFLLARGAAANASPALRALYDEKREIEVKIDALRALKPKMEPATYDKELERLLLDLALKNQQIKKLEGVK